MAKVSSRLPPSPHSIDGYRWLEKDEEILTKSRAWIRTKDYGRRTKDWMASQTGNCKDEEDEDEDAFEEDGADGWIGAERDGGQSQLSGK